MKKNSVYILLILLFLNAGTIWAQQGFDKFNNQSQVETVVVTKKMFQMMANVKTDPSDKENMAYINLIKKLDVLKSYKTKNSTKALDFKNTVADYVKQNSMEELMRTSDQGATIVFYVNKGATRADIKELLMFTEGGAKSETAILNVTGNFSLDELSALTGKMQKLSGGGS